VLHALLCLLPALALAVPLLARRYPGERVLLALRGSKRVERPPRPRAYLPSRGREAIAAVRGGRLIGCSLAVRPPPASLVAS